MTDLEANTDVIDHLIAAAHILSTQPIYGKSGEQVRLSLGRCLISAGNFESARSLADQVLAGSPINRAAMLLKVDAAINAGNISDALEAIDAGRAQFLSETEFLRMKLAAMRRCGQMTETIPVLESLHRNDPQDADVLVELGRRHFQNRSYLDAHIAFGRALSIDKNSVGAWTGKIDLANTQDDPVTASEIAEQALSALPENPVIVERTARARLALGQLEEARKLLETTLEKTKTPKPGIILALALALSRLGEFAASEKLYQNVLADDPSHVGAWSNRIQAFISQGDVDRALTLCAEALENCPEAPNLERQRAQILHLAGKDGKALASLESLLSRQPDDVPTALALAGVFRLVERLDEADSLYQKILATQPSNWPALSGRVAIAERRGDLEMAMELLEKGSSAVGTRASSPA